MCVTKIVCACLKHTAFCPPTMMHSSTSQSATLSLFISTLFGIPMQLLSNIHTHTHSFRVHSYTKRQIHTDAKKRMHTQAPTEAKTYKTYTNRDVPTDTHLVLLILISISDEHRDCRGDDGIPQPITINMSIWKPHTVVGCVTIGNM